MCISYKVHPRAAALNWESTFFFRAQGAFQGQKPWQRLPFPRSLLLGNLSADIPTSTNDQTVASSFVRIHTHTHTSIVSPWSQCVRLHCAPTRRLLTGTRSAVWVRRLRAPNRSKRSRHPRTGWGVRGEWIWYMEVKELAFHSVIMPVQPPGPLLKCEHHRHGYFIAKLQNQNQQR